jgi:threonine synthase
MAARRGVPVGHFVSATTINDPFPRYLTSGTFTPQDAVPTLASAMDVGHPSNLERLTWLYDGDVARMREAVTGVVVTDDEVQATIRALQAEHGYIADPHTAVGWLGARKAGRHGDGPVVVLATAHPAKFPEVVEPTLGAAVALPPALAERLALDVVATHIPPRLEALAAVLAGTA